jgi:aminotransferase in exopolysaccharide biosynthesis
MTFTTYEKIVNFIKELYGSDFVPLHQPLFGEEEKKFLLEALESTYVSSVGPFVEKFEKAVAKYTGAKYAVATVNGTSALHLALLTSGVGEGDEVITQPLTFVGTCNAIRYCGAQPVFVDVSPTTLGMSAESLEYFLKKYVEIKDGQAYNKVTKRRVKACVPVHIFGHPTEIDRIVELCRHYNIRVIEDSAQALGSFYKGKHLGTFGDVGIFSFNGNKIITTGGGGVLITDNEEIARRAKHLSTTAKRNHPYEYYHDELGFNYRMPNINAALGLAQISKLDKFVETKRKLAQIYRSFFQDLEGVEFVEEPPGGRSNYWLNALRFPSKEERTQFLEFSNKRGVQTRAVWTLMYKLPMYKDSFRIPTPTAEEVEEKIVNIPSGVIY